MRQAKQLRKQLQQKVWAVAQKALPRPVYRDSPACLQPSPLQLLAPALVRHLGPLGKALATPVRLRGAQLRLVWSNQQAKPPRTERKYWVVASNYLKSRDVTSHEKFWSPNAGYPGCSYLEKEQSVNLSTNFWVNNGNTNRLWFFPFRADRSTAAKNKKSISLSSGNSSRGSVWQQRSSAACSSWCSPIRSCSGTSFRLDRECALDRMYHKDATKMSTMKTKFKRRNETYFCSSVKK